MLVVFSKILQKKISWRIFLEDLFEAFSKIKNYFLHTKITLYPYVGHVDTSQKVKTKNSENREYFIGLSGKKIDVCPEWENETDEWNIGILDLKKLFPPYLELEKYSFNSYFQKIVKKNNFLDISKRFGKF